VKRLRLTYRPAALADLDSIFDFIEADSPTRAASFVDEILSRCGALGVYPELGPVRHDLGVGIRIYPMFGRIVVAYRVADDAVQVIRVFSSGQDYATILTDGDTPL
jgi:toxin ParE1/3/4